MNKLHLLPEGISKVSEIIDKMVSEKCFQLSWKKCFQLSWKKFR